MVIIRYDRRCSKSYYRTGRKVGSRASEEDNLHVWDRFCLEHITLNSDEHRSWALVGDLCYICMRVYLRREWRHPRNSYESRIAASPKEGRMRAGWLGPTR